jgi:hypothetical protein
MMRASLHKVKIPLNPPLLKGEELLWLKGHLRHGGVSPLKGKIPLNPPDQRVTVGLLKGEELLIPPDQRVTSGLRKGPVLLCINQRGRDVSLCDTGQGRI